MGKLFNSRSLAGLAETTTSTEVPTMANAIAYEPTTTDAHSPLATKAIPTAAQVSFGYLLEDCRTSTEDICVYSISPQPNSVIIAIKYKNGIDPSNLPYLTVGSNKVNCEILPDYPGRLYCTSSPISGNLKLILRYSEINNICSGTFTIKEYVAPVPTKKNSSGGKYP